MEYTDIIEGLRCCDGSGSCNNCPFKSSDASTAKNCSVRLSEAAIEIIERQKSEIDKLKEQNDILSENADTAFQDGLNEAQELYAEQIKSKLIKECYANDYAAIQRQLGIIEGISIMLADSEAAMLIGVVQAIEEVLNKNENKPTADEQST